MNFSLKKSYMSLQCITSETEEEGKKINILLSVWYLYCEFGRCKIESCYCSYYITSSCTVKSYFLSCLWCCSFLFLQNFFFFGELGKPRKCRGGRTYRGNFENQLKGLRIIFWCFVRHTVAHHQISRWIGRERKIYTWENTHQDDDRRNYDQQGRMRVLFKSLICCLWEMSGLAIEVIWPSDLFSCKWWTEGGTKTREGVLPSLLLGRKFPLLAVQRFAKAQS